MKEENGIVNLELELKDNSIIYWNQQTRIGLPTQITLRNTKNIVDYHIGWPWPSFKAENSTTYAYYHDFVKIPIYITQADQNMLASFDIKISYLLCNDYGCFPKEELISSQLKNGRQLSQLAINDKQEIFLQEGKIYVAKSIHDEGIALLSNKEIYLPLDTRQIGNKNYDVFHVEDLQESNQLSLFTSSSNNPKIYKLSEIGRKDKTRSVSIIIFGLYALLGGFILNFMPCVLPVLSIKLHSLLHSSNILEKRSQSIISTLTIVSFFMSLGAMTAIAKHIGKFFIPGFNMQIPYIIIICMALITYVMSILRGTVSLNINLMGQENYQSKNQYVNTIITTLVSTILATPCTAPFLASSMSFAITQDTEIILLMFFLSSIGFATPYLLVIIWPAMLEFAPRPGKWQEYLKNFFLLLLLLSICWLFLVLSSQIGYAASIFVLLSLYFFRLIIEKEMKRSVRIVLLLILAILIYVISNNIQANFASYNKHVSDVWGKFSYPLLEKYRKDHYMVFVYVSAEWCITCQYNQLIVLDNSKTQVLFKEYNIKLLKADITSKNPEAEAILMRHHAAGIPFAIIFSDRFPEGVSLPVMFDYEDLFKIISK